VDWQVWNAAVPGYNTSQELALLVQSGSRFKPDLVVVGFYPNDIVDNYPVVQASRAAVVTSGITSSLRRHVYSIELYKKVLLTLAWKLSRSDEYQKRLDHLGTEDSLLDKPSLVARLGQQAITNYTRYSDEEVKTHVCNGGQTPNPKQIRDMQNDTGWPAWVRAVREIQQLHRNGTYSIMFFLNEIPLVCPDGDYFYDKALRQENDLFMRIMGDGTPAVSVFDAFLHRRPSEMPQAIAHAIGNANMTKAETLFMYLRSELLPHLHHPALAEIGQPQP
jgi:hypothetical protein